MREMEDNNLKEAILKLHGIDSAWIESIPIKEMFGQDVV
jgi:hypothetical protein